MSGPKPKRGNPNMVKGGPSVNPLGRAAPVEKAKHPPGFDAVLSWGGHLHEGGEGSGKLAGREKWVTYANAYTHPAVAIALLLRSALLSGVKWSLTENPSGSAAAKRGVEIVEKGLLKARLPKPWSSVARRATNGRYFNGFSLHATALQRRKDGLVVFTDIDDRPPHTIDKWYRDTPQAPWRDVEQRLDDGKTALIPLADCLYLVNDVIGNSPTGTGVLRFVVERLRRIHNYETLEGSEMFSSMGGTPIYRVPREKLMERAPGATEAEKQAWVDKQTAAIREAVKNRVKTPEKQMYLGLSSLTYQGSDPNSISTVKEWDIEILKGELHGLAEIRAVIDKNDLHIARILGVEFAFVGGGDSAGTYGMHESKVDLFTATLQSDLALTAECADHQIIRRLVAANGEDPDEAAPSLTPSRIVRRDVLRTAQALGLLQVAGLGPNHPAKIALFNELDLPWVDEDEVDLMAPRRTAPRDDESEDDEIADVESESGDNTNSSETRSGSEDARARVDIAPQDAALSGAQVSAAVEIAILVATGEIAPEAARLMLVQFFGIPDHVAASIVEGQQRHAEVPAETAPEPSPPSLPIDEETAEKAKKKTLASLLRELAPNGRCDGCGQKRKLEVHHVNGRDWEPNKLSRSQRIARYWREYEDGVEMTALCRSCNTSDGAKNKQEH